MEDVLKPTQGSRKSIDQRDILRMLLQAALTESPSSPSDSSPGSSKENHSHQVNGDNDGLHDQEAKQLYAVKRLMEIKGYEAMMKFLES